MTIKIKPVDIKSSTYIDFNEENNKEDPKFEVDDYVRISQCKKIFAKGYTANWSEEDFVIQKLKTLWRGHMLSVIVIVKTLLEPFTKKNCKRQVKMSSNLKK